MAEKPSYWLKPITAEERKPHGCFTCDAAGILPITFPPDGLIAVGFGSADVTKDGRCVLNGEDPDLTDYITGADAEKLAAADPDHDWRIDLQAPLSGRTYQRQGEGNWVLVDQNEGFA